MKKLFIIILTLGLLIGGCVNKPTYDNNSLFFMTTDLNGNEVDQSIFADHKLTMINLWATWCSPCVMEIPDIAKLSANYATKDLNVIGLLCDGVTVGTLKRDEKAISDARKILADANADYLIILPDQTLMNRLVKRLTYYPTTVFVDNKGNFVGSSCVGARNYEEWQVIVEELLAQM